MESADRASSLAKAILANPDRSDLGELTNELLSEYCRGGSLSSLRRLLRSENERIAACSAWIAGELGALGRPLLPEVSRLIRHPLRDVRFYAIECIQEWAGPSDSEELSMVISLLGDPDEAVRWKAMVFLAFAPRSQLEAAAGAFASTDTELAPDADDPANVSLALQGICPRHRKFAAAAAARIAGTHVEPLRLAATMDDSEIAQFAQDMLERLATANGVSKGES